MALSIRIAKRYAKAVIDLAEQKNELDVIKSDMELFLTTAEQSRDFELMLASPIVSQSKKWAVLDKIYRSKIADASLNLLKLLTDKKREEYLLLIAEQYLAQYNVIKNIQIATLYTSVTVSESIKNEAKSLVSKATGKTVEIIEQIREDLIGGFILRIDDIQLDASVKSQLNRLSIKFRNA